MSGKRFAFFISLSASVAAGCTSLPRLKAYAGDLPPEQLATLVLDARVRLVSVDGQQFPGATEDEAAGRARAVAEAPAVAKEGNYSFRHVQVAAGERTFVFGIAKHLITVDRETNLAPVALTGDVKYLKKMYPGSLANDVYRLPTLAGRTYTVRLTYDRPNGGPQTWAFKILDSKSSRPVATFVGKAAPSVGGTELSPIDWAEKSKQYREAAK